MAVVGLRDTYVLDKYLFRPGDYPAGACPPIGRWHSDIANTGDGSGGSLTQTMQWKAGLQSGLAYSVDGFAMTVSAVAASRYYQFQIACGWDITRDNGAGTARHLAYATELYVTTGETALRNIYNCLDIDKKCKFLVPRGTGYDFRALLTTPNVNLEGISWALEGWVWDLARIETDRIWPWRPW